MARILSQTLIRESQALIHDPPPPHLISACKSSFYTSPSSRFIKFRGRSKRPEKAQLLEVELEADAAGSGSEVEVLGIRRLEDAIHGIIVRRSAPDWLPFIPGSSYWVPPRKRSPLGVVELVGKLANPMTEEESLSFTTIHGWPSSAYFVEGVLPHPMKKSPEKAGPQSDDEES